MRVLRTCLSGGSIVAKSAQTIPPIPCTAAAPRPPLDMACRSQRLGAAHRECPAAGGCRRSGAGACTRGPGASARLTSPLPAPHPPPRCLACRYRSWRERLHIEEATGVGFDRAWSEAAGFAFQFRHPTAGGEPWAVMGAAGWAHGTAG